MGWDTLPPHPWAKVGQGRPKRDSSCDSEPQIGEIEGNMERESKMKGWSRDMEEEEKGRARARARARKCQDANLSAFQIWGGGSLALLGLSPPNTRFGGQHEPGSVPELYVQ